MRLVRRLPHRGRKGAGGDRQGRADRALEEVEADLPARCLICAMPEDDGHTPDCPIPSLRAGFRALDGGS